MSRASVVQMLNESEGFWLAALAREVWPLAQHHLDSLKDSARWAVEHYRDHLGTCQTFNETDGCTGCRAA